MDKKGKQLSTHWLTTNSDTHFLLRIKSIDRKTKDNHVVA